MRDFAEVECDFSVFERTIEDGGRICVDAAVFFDAVGIEFVCEESVESGGNDAKDMAERIIECVRSDEFPFIFCEESGNGGDFIGLIIFDDVFTFFIYDVERGQDAIDAKGLIIFVKFSVALGHLCDDLEVIGRESEDFAIFVNGLFEGILILSIELCEDSVEFGVIREEVTRDLVGGGGARDIVKLFESEVTEAFAKDGKELGIDGIDIPLTLDHAFVIGLDCEVIFLREQDGEQALEDSGLIGFKIEDIVIGVDGAFRIIKFIFEDDGACGDVPDFFVVIVRGANERVDSG